MVIPTRRFLSEVPSIRTTSAVHRIARGCLPGSEGNSTSTVRRTPIEGNGIVGNQRSRIPVRLKFWVTSTSAELIGVDKTFEGPIRQTS
jgi:hypothetical protein